MILESSRLWLIAATAMMLEAALESDRPWERFKKRPVWDNGLLLE